MGDVFQMGLYANVSISRWNGGSSPSIASKFMRQLLEDKAKLGYAPMVGVGIFTADTPLPDELTMRAMALHRDDFFAALQSIHFVFEDDGTAGVIKRLRLRVPRWFAWAVSTAFPMLVTGQHNSLTEALACAKIARTAPDATIVAAARADGLVRAVRGPDAPIREIARP